MVDFECFVAMIEQITAKMEAHPERMGVNMNAYRDATEAAEGLPRRGRKL